MAMAIVEKLGIFNEMKTFNGISDISEPIPSTVVTVGNFDGLHLGHRQLVDRLIKMAKRLRANAVVYTFDPHPMEVLAPSVGHKYIFTKSDLQEQLSQLGIDRLVIEPFTRDFSRTPPIDFLEKYLIKGLNAKGLVVGHDFAFGEQRSGTLDWLREFCESRHLELDVVQPVSTEFVVSSSKIRQSIRLGQMQQVADMLGRPYYVTGKVVPGDGRGRTIGVPTVNLSLSSDIQPAPGVYITSVFVDEQWLPSVSNIGCKPTFQKNENHKVFSVETHILDFNNDLYGETIRVQFHERLRDEQKFDGVESLVKQIKKDIQLSRRWFEKCRP